MASAYQRPLIINDGGPGGLIACWAEGVHAERPDAAPGPIAWFPAAPTPTLETRRRAARSQVELCSLSEFLEHQLAAAPSEKPGHAPSSPDPARGLCLTQLLLHAAHAAAERGISRVVWPVHFPDSPGDSVDLDALADACDRALLVSQLAALDTPSEHPVIETPYADFTDRELLELARDLDAPLDACWYCHEPGESPCGSCPGCTLWHRAADEIASPAA